MELIYVYRTKWPVPKQGPIVMRMRSAVSITLMATGDVVLGGGGGEGVCTHP